MRSARVREHAQDVLGAPVVFNALVAWDRVPALPRTRVRLRTSTVASKDCAAMLMPAGGELFSVYMDARKGMFVQAQDDADALYVLDARWGALRVATAARASSNAATESEKERLAAAAAAAAARGSRSIPAAASASASGHFLLSVYGYFFEHLDTYRYFFLE